MIAISPLGMNWLEAASDLGIRVTAPYSITAPSGERFLFDALVHDFGAVHGMLLMEQWSSKKADAAMESGYGFSCIGVGRYDRESTIEVLKDWSWSSSTTAPDWLGSPGSERAGLGVDDSSG